MVRGDGYMHVHLSRIVRMLCLMLHVAGTVTVCDTIALRDWRSLSTLITFIPTRLRRRRLWRCHLWHRFKRLHCTVSIAAVSRGWHVVVHAVLRGDGSSAPLVLLVVRR